MMRAPVNKIIPFSNVDGPGNRTSIFFQGCPFNCLFCHNPETIHLCRGCGLCVQSCPAGALRMDGESVVWDSAKCVGCDTCIKLCPHDASPKIRWMTVEDVVEEVRRAAPYIEGITTSGGECTLRNEFLIELFTAVHKLGKTCLIDSNGSFDFEKDPRVLAVSEGVMLDVKAVEQSWSDELISHPRDVVLKNLDYLLSVGKLHEVRTVILPNRDRENEETVRYVAAHIADGCFYKIIRYRPYGVRERYQKLLGEFETDAAYAEYARHMAAVRAEGKRIIDAARAEGRHIIVLAGRPYHVDPEINHGIDTLITRSGAAVVTEDAVSHLVQPFETSVLNQWTYHARLYAAARYCCSHPDMNLVQLVSFGCGVDAITTDEVRSILQSGGRLYTQLKIDEISNPGAVRIRLRSLFAALEQ